jgi:hypothetical protein
MSSFTEELEYEFTGSYFKGNPVYVITKEFTYKLGSEESPLHTFRVPVGYETDLATIPFPVNIVFKPNGPWAKAAVIHDFIYTDYPEVSKVVADSIFLEAMLVLNINVLIAYIFYFAVRAYQFFVNKS